MIEAFLTTLLMNTIGAMIFILYIFTILVLCMERNFSKETYPRKELILDLIIPFRYFYRKFYNLFKN